MTITGQIQDDIQEDAIHSSAQQQKDNGRYRSQCGAVTDRDTIAIDEFRACERDTKLKRQQEFLTFDRPIFTQFMEKNFSKEFYMEQVHIPRKLDYPARFFESDICEALTKNHWWITPVVWIPVALLMFWISTEDVASKVVIFFEGLLLWTLLEYGFHRGVFHCESLLPDNKYFLVVHFFTHGVHHFFPFDGLRLAMPPALFTILASITWTVFNQFIATQPLLPLFSGIFVGFTIYDVLHYYFHHGAEKSKLGYIREMRKYHAIHHYKTPELGYGVSSKLWDWVFGTLIETKKIA